MRNDRYAFTEDYDVNLPIDIDMTALYWADDVELGRWNEEFEPDDNNIAIITSNA